MISESCLYGALAGAAVGIYFIMNLVEIVQALKDFSLPIGRMNILPGIKHTFIIDDTYNFLPEAAIAAVDILGRIKIDESATRYAVLGDIIRGATDAVLADDTSVWKELCRRLWPSRNGPRNYWFGRKRSGGRNKLGFSPDIILEKIKKANKKGRFSRSGLLLSGLLN